LEKNGTEWPANGLTAHRLRAYTSVHASRNYDTPVDAISPMQGELNFDDGAENSGYIKWLTGRKVAAAELARRIHLPIGHEVEVWLFGGVRLRGRLRLEEEVLFLDEQSVRHLALKIERVTFKYREMESCIRLD
jgi:hypothetical protein